MDEKYKKVEILIAQKTEESADARRKAEMLQNEAKTLLAQANSKLQLLKGRSQAHAFIKYFNIRPPQSLFKRLKICSLCLGAAGDRDHSSINGSDYFFLSPTDLERKYEDNQKYLEDKAQELVRLEGEVRSLLKDISQKVAVYSTCL